MNSHHEHVHHEPGKPFLDRWWQVLLILFGLTFTLCLALFRPGDAAVKTSLLGRYPPACVTHHVDLQQG